MPEKRLPPTVSTPQIASVRLPETASAPASLTVPFLQGPGTNMLSALSTTARNGAYVSFEPEINLVEVGSRSGKMQISFSAYNPQSMSHFKVSTSKLLDALVIKFTQQNRYHEASDKLRTQVRIPLQEYLHMLGRNCDDPRKQKNQLDALRKSVDRDLMTLFNLSMTWTESTGRKGDKATRSYRHMRVLSSVGVKNGVIEASFSPELAAYLVNSYIMEYNLLLLTVSERTPATYHLGRKLIQTLNYARKKNHQANSSIISVRSLIESCPDIPSFEEVAENGRRYTRDIINPLQTALDGLSNFIRWEYCAADGKPLSAEQTADFRSIADACIRFTVTESQPLSVE